MQEICACAKNQSDGYSLKVEPMSEGSLSSDMVRVYFPVSLPRSLAESLVKALWEIDVNLCATSDDFGVDFWADLED